MAVEKNAIERLVASLHSKSATLSEAFYDKRLSASDDNRVDINVLLSVNALAPLGELYIVTPALRRAFDSMAGDVHVRRIDVGLADRLDDLRQMVDMHQAAIIGMNFEGAADWRIQIEELLAEISVSLDTATRQLEMQITNRFAQYKTIAEKTSQTYYFSKQAQKLLDAVESFNKSDFLEKMRDYPDVYGQLFFAKSQRVPIYLDRIRAVIDELKGFMFVYKDMEKKTRSFKNLHAFLDSNPAWQLRELCNDEVVQSWLHVAEPREAKPHPVVRDSPYRDQLAEIASKLPAVAAVRERETRGVAVIADAVQHVVAPVIKPAEMAIRSFARHVKSLSSEAGVSALTYYAQASEEFNVSKSVWMYMVLVRFQRDKQLQRYFSIELISPMEDNKVEYRQNRVVSDVIVRLRK